MKVMKSMKSILNRCFRCVFLMKVMKSMKSILNRCFRCVFFNESNEKYEKYS